MFSIFAWCIVMHFSPTNSPATFQKLYEHFSSMHSAHSSPEEFVLFSSCARQVTSALGSHKWWFAEVRSASILFRLDRINVVRMFLDFVFWKSFDSNARKTHNFRLSELQAPETQSMKANSPSQTARANLIQWLTIWFRNFVSKEFLRRFRLWISDSWTMRSHSISQLNASIKVPPRSGIGVENLSGRQEALSNQFLFVPRTRQMESFRMSDFLSQFLIYNQPF